MIKNSLSEISRQIVEELNQFDDLFKSSLKSKVGLVDLVTKYILKQKGKKIRPLLVLLSAKASGGITQKSYRGAILVELLHTATLVHDDVVDNSEKRRGFPSINAVWKNKIAVLMGDYLLARGLMIAVDGQDFDSLRVITNTVRRMSEGELLQTSKTRKLNIDEATYFRIISDKTASLLSTCCEIGALSATDDPQKIDAMREFGESLGMAFQIRDDILDFIGSSKLFGKPVGGDIKEKKITLPLIYALQQVEKEESKRIISLIKNGNDKEKIEKVIGFVKKNNGLDYAEEVAQRYSQKAVDCLKIFPDSPSQNALQSLIEFVIHRKN